MTDTSLGSIDPAELAQLLNSPALDPPPGVTPDFEHPPNNNNLTHTIVSICIVLTTVAFLFRLCARRFFFKKPDLRDCILICIFGLYVGVIWAIYSEVAFPGTFVHQWNVTVGTLHIFLYSIFVGTILVVLLLPLIKVAILLDWIQLFVPRGNKNFVFWSCHFLIWVNLLFYLAIFFAINFACTPYERNWNNLVPGSCHVDTDKTNLAAAIVNGVSDLLILALSQKTIWGLQLSTKKKVGVATVFAVGILACVSAAFRIVVSVQHLVEDDYTYTFSEVSLCVVAEATCGMLVLCVPTIPQAIMVLKGSKVMKSLRTHAGSSRGTNVQSKRDVEVSWPRPDVMTTRSNGYIEIQSPSGNIHMKTLASGSREDDIDALHHSNGAILRTTQFHVEEGYIPKEPTRDRGHEPPWA
ncbi:hypothetical protein F4810DRAFT_555912 [Camillea tinctor]|nr:hypothetical protein F4810DRAFT_555912 [Camillea tinctor]